MTGTPSAGDSLVFHFLTSQSATGSGSTNPNVGYTYWQLFLSGGSSGSSGSSSASVTQVTNADGTQRPLSLYHATQTATGFDLTLPFVAGPTFNYFFGASAVATASGPLVAQGTTLSSALTVTLAGVDARTASGATISSASFDPLTGLGTISAIPQVTVTPEPGSLALLGSGVVGLAPFVQRRKRKGKA